jgi:prepilin-type N-terminal cleavage/methylation domain-containing protein
MRIENTKLRIEAQILYLWAMYRSLPKFHGSGFTLIELVLALAISTIFLGLVGSGLVIVTKQDRAAAADRVSRYELQRALSFIGNEIQMAQLVSPCPPSFNSSVKGSTNPYPVLSLTMPIESGLTEPIIYYVAAPPTTSPWSGPLVIYRWGPTLTLKGSYSKNAKAVNYTYYNEVVVDKITANLLPTSCDAVFTAAIPASQSQGFAACVEPNGTAAKLAVTRSSDHDHRDISLHAIFSRRSRSMSDTNSSICP